MNILYSISNFEQVYPQWNDYRKEFYEFWLEQEMGDLEVPLHWSR